MSKKPVSIEKLLKKAKKALDEHKDIYFFSDLAVELGYSRQYLYEIGFCPDKNDTLKTLLDENKKMIKRGLRNKWYTNDNATTQVALYKLLADEDELKRLNNNTDLNLNSDGFKIVVEDKRAEKALEDI